MARTTGVLGAGALGLTLAYRLAQAGDEVTVIEREPEPGGLAAGFRVGPAWMEKFYHHLFRSDRAATRMIEEVGLGDRLVWPRPITATLINGEIRQLDSPLSLLRYRPLPFHDRVRMGMVLAYLKYVEKSHTRLEGKTADAWLRAWMGPRGYELQWEPLLKSKFHHHYTEIALPWFWSRVHLRSSELGYLRGGFQQLYNRLAELVGERGGDLRFSESVTSIAAEEDGSVRVGVGRKRPRFDRVVSTLPTRVTLALTKGLPDEYRQRYDWGMALGAHCVVLELDRRFGEVYWLNVNDPGYPFLALVEHTNYMPPEDYDGRHLMYLGNYLPMDHPLFTKSVDEVLAAFLPHLRRINPAFRDEWVTKAHVFAAPYAQPVVTPDFPRHIPPHQTPLPNLYMANMFQVYPQDRGQNYSVAMAERLAQRLTAGLDRFN